MQESVGSWSSDRRLAAGQNCKFSKTRIFRLLSLLSVSLAHYLNSRPHILISVSFEGSRDLRVEASRQPDVFNRHAGLQA
jgi:hypothetical protein